MMKPVSAFLLIASLVPQEAIAQNDTLTIDDYYIDFVVPDISALSLLKLKNDAIVRPGNLKELALAISSLANTSGDLTPGIGIEYAPLMSIVKKDESFWKNRVRWQNVAVTAATNRVDTLGTRLALGFKWVPLDNGDPLGDRNFYDEITEYLVAFRSTTSIGDKSKFTEDLASLLINSNIQPEALLQISGTMGIADERYKAKLRTRFSEGEIKSYKKFISDSLQTVNAYTSLSEVDKTRIDSFVDLFVTFLLKENTLQGYLEEVIRKRKEAYKKKHWNALAFQVSGGWVWNSPTSSYNDLDKERMSVLLSFSTPVGLNKWFKRHGQFILHAQTASDHSALTVERSKESAGARLLLGNADNRFSLEGMYSHTALDKDDAEDINFFRWSAGAEIKLGPGSWLEVSIGGVKKLKGESTEILPSFGLKHAFLNKRRLDTN